MWRLDDWFRPVHPGATMPDGATREPAVLPALSRAPGRRRETTPRDRLLSVIFLSALWLFLAYASLRYHWGARLAAASVGPTVVQLVVLYRSRSVGFGWRR